MRLSVTIILTILFTLIPAALFLYVVVLAIRALRTYIRTNGVRQEKNQIKRTLGEALKEHRLRCQMTQEFVAESVGVSRQAVSKWERGIPTPAPPTCWPWPSCSASPPRSCCGMWPPPGKKPTQNKAKPTRSAGGLFQFRDSGPKPWGSSSFNGTSTYSPSPRAANTRSLGANS